MAARGQEVNSSPTATEVAKPAPGEMAFSYPASACCGKPKLKVISDAPESTEFLT